MTDNLCKKAAELNVHIATGILEKDDSKLYDSAVLISPTEGIVLKYRRMSPRWHGRSADPKLYCEGTEVGKCDTPLGSFAFLICGDLFDEHIRTKVRELQPDWLLHLMARSLEDGSFDQVQWDKEKLEYVEQIKSCGTTTLMVNYLASEELEDKNFGGAMVVLPNGEILFRATHRQRRNTLHGPLSRFLLRVSDSEVQCKSAFSTPLLPHSLS